MNFNKKKIRTDNAEKKVLHKLPPDKQKAKLITTSAGAIIILILILGFVSFIRNFDLSTIVFSFGKSLKTDRFGHTNIVLAGIGGEGHDGADLTDTLMVASIDYESKGVTMLSIPRDLYVKSGKLNSGERINEIYFLGKKRFNSSEAGLEELKNVTAALVGIPIDYYIKVDFKGFKKIIDNLGGVDVMIEKDIYDPFYPLGESTNYQTFALKAGFQHLDGETALKYARSRKTTSDFDRASRQQHLLTAIKEKTLKLNILDLSSKIKKIYETVKESLETDMALNEIITLVKAAKEFGRENIRSFVLGDNPNECGGFLYTPAREFFNGAYVLLPAGNSYDDIHLFTQTVLNKPQLLAAENPIQILNGTKKPNIATEVTNFLARMCLNVIHYGNAQNRDLTKTTIYYQPDTKGEKPKILDFIKDFLPFKTQPGIPAVYLNDQKKQKTAIVIELGQDYMERRLYDPFQKLSLLAPPKPRSNSEEIIN